MTTPFNERLSAFVDDELSEFEARRMAKELAESPELRAKWTRYQLIGSVMRDEDLSSVDPAFAEAIAAKIAVEPLTILEAEEPHARQRDVNGWLKPVVGVAIAASVAAAAILVVGRLLAPVDETVPVASVGAEPDVVVEAQPGASKQPASPFGSAAPAIPSGIVTPVSSSQLGNVAVEPAKAHEAELDLLLDDPLFSSFLATHAEFAAHTGILPRIRVVGFAVPAE